MNDSFLHLTALRTSCRSYDPNRDVSDKLIRRCLTAAVRSPSACNKQPWRFVIVKDPEKRKALCERGILPGLSFPWLKDAPVIVALCAQSNVGVHLLAPLLSSIPYHLLDLGIAGEHFVLEASELGLGTCWIGWTNTRQVRKILEIPLGIQLVSLLSLGYPLNPKPSPEKKPVEAVTFQDSWGSPWS